MSGPLAGIRILDLTSVVMGPYATQVLGDYGADIIKVESPDGDVLRQSGPMRHAGMGHFFMTTNRNKRSIVIDMKQASGREVILRLARDADALVYNIRPQAMARLGLSYEAVREVAPKIIYAGAFGFSQRGTYAEKPAYDDLIQGMCGLPWLAREGGADRPRYAPIVMADRMAGLQLTTAITSALLYRERTGKGQRVDVPMFEGMVSIVAGEHMAGELYDPPVGPTGYQRSLAHDRRPLQTSDGYICVMVYNDKHWRSFFGVIDQPEVFRDDARFNTHGARLIHIKHVYGFLSETLKTRSTQEWLDLFEKADIPAARMYSINDIMSDEHLASIDYFRTVEHPTEGKVFDTAIPTEWSESVPETRCLAPTLGQDTRAVLAEFGYSTEAIEALEKSGAVRGSE
ncbi:MAG: CaiB/BaiF CoA transferase family protein [Janthinobacterium lividum]